MFLFCSSSSPNKMSRLTNKFSRNKHFLSDAIEMNRSIGLFYVLQNNQIDFELPSFLLISFLKQFSKANMCVSHGQMAQEVECSNTITFWNIILQYNKCHNIWLKVNKCAGCDWKDASVIKSAKSEQIFRFCHLFSFQWNGQWASLPTIIAKYLAWKWRKQRIISLTSIELLLVHFAKQMV